MKSRPSRKGRKTRKQSRRRLSRRRLSRRRLSRRMYRKHRGGDFESFNERVPDKALVTVRDAEDEESPFYLTTKDEAMEELTLSSERM